MLIHTYSITRLAAELPSAFVVVVVVAVMVAAAAAAAAMCVCVEQAGGVSHAPAHPAARARLLVALTEHSAQIHTPEPTARLISCPLGEGRGCPV